MVYVPGEAHDRHTPEVLLMGVDTTQTHAASIDPDTDAALAVDRERLTAVVRRVVGRPDAQLATVQVRPASHQVENMTTQALTHVWGTLADGTPWRVFAKTLRPAWHAPLWEQIPPTFHDQVRRTLDWQDEPHVYTSPLARDLPSGLRLPRLYGVDRGEERITLWLEDVDDTQTWDAARYQRTARQLGRLAGRWPEHRVVAELGLRRRPHVQTLFSKVTHQDLPALADDALWQTPALQAATARHGDLRGDLHRLAAVAPALVEAYEDLPHALAHGDATPHNWHEPTPGDTVAIDLSYVGPAALGSDLSQLLVGRFESGTATDHDLDDIGTTLLPAYLDGLADEGLDVDPDHVEAGWAITLAIRSVFTALLVDHRPDLHPTTRDQLLARRALTCRFGLDLALNVANRLR